MMRTFNWILAFFIVLATVASCNDDPNDLRHYLLNDTGGLDRVASVEALSALPSHLFPES